jgi:hypothetical protein
METLTEAKPFVDDPGYKRRRQAALIELENQLNAGTIDSPVIEIVKGFNRLPFCFTLQSCFGHFVHKCQKDSRNVEPLSDYQDELSVVNYRIAYMALCLRNNKSGRMLFNHFDAIAKGNPDCIQFGSAEWFWKVCPNSYVLQVEPSRSRNKDRIRVNIKEALHIESVRNKTFGEIRKLLQQKELLSERK